MPKANAEIKCRKQMPIPNAESRCRNPMPKADAESKRKTARAADLSRGGTIKCVSGTQCACRDKP
eukprot:328393-Rhodomonas_salina.1